MNEFINFKDLAENQTGLKIKRFRSDNGTEYCNSAFGNFYRKCGIIHETTVRYTPQQNGVSERLKRTVMEKARSVLQDPGLSKRY
jgi:transposase InsO family protein